LKGEVENKPLFQEKLGATKELTQAKLCLLKFTAQAGIVLVLSS